MRVKLRQRSGNLPLNQRYCGGRRRERTERQTEWLRRMRGPLGRENGPVEVASSVLIGELCAGSLHCGRRT